ncbi:hypothetical protein B0H14DRAFT_1064707 [Mycena olivaceomarginata]|nr:hypothetical protein B0H14DRAFT_1064707 [Mycena olivaceomarginata]
MVWREARANRSVWLSAMTPHIHLARNRLGLSLILPHSAPRTASTPRGQGRIDLSLFDHRICSRIRIGNRIGDSPDAASDTGSGGEDGGTGGAYSVDIFSSHPIRTRTLTRVPPPSPAIPVYRRTPWDFEWDGGSAPPGMTVATRPILSEWRIVCTAGMTEKKTRRDGRIHDGRARSPTFEPLHPYMRRTFLFPVSPLLLQCKL